MDNVVATENICYRFGQIIYPHTYLDTKTTYGYTKALSARIVEHYGGTVKVLTNVFGYDGPGVIDSYLRKYEKDESLGICLGETRFDFVHMDEVVRRLISTAFSYVGSGKLLSLESVANMFPLGTTRHYFQGTPHTHRIQEPKSLCSGMTVEEYIGRNI